MISGIRAHAEIAVRAGYKLIQFSDLPEEFAECVDEYLMSLKPVPTHSQIQYLRRYGASSYPYNKDRYDTRHISVSQTPFFPLSPYPIIPHLLNTD